MPPPPRQRPREYEGSEINRELNDAIADIRQTLFDVVLIGQYLMQRQVLRVITFCYVQLYGEIWSELEGTDADDEL